MEKFSGLSTNMSNLHQLSNAKSRSISPENFTGEKGKGGMAKIGEGTTSRHAQRLGQGWKVNPFIYLKAGQVHTIAEIDGPGAINHIWMTLTGVWRHTILRIYWDDQETPSVEVPAGDFFCNGWNSYAHVNSLAVCVNPGSGFNCYWTMPFRKKCKMTMENLDDKDVALFYQIDHTLTEVADDVGYFHTHFRRVNPLPFKEVFTILDGVAGKGQFVGCYMAWGVNNNLWWGEGEIKFYLDGDKEFPTICGTGTEDYFCGSYCFWDKDKNYVEYSTAYTGLNQVIRPDGKLNSQQRFGMYRWHITDPIRFEENIRVTIQALGWRRNYKEYLPLQDDLASVAYWYQTLPTKPFKPLPSLDDLEII